MSPALTCACLRSCVARSQGHDAAGACAVLAPVDVGGFLDRRLKAARAWTAPGSLPVTMRGYRTRQLPDRSARRSLRRSGRERRRVTLVRGERPLDGGGLLAREWRTQLADGLHLVRPEHVDPPRVGVASRFEDARRSPSNVTLATRPVRGFSVGLMYSAVVGCVRVAKVTFTGGVVAASQPSPHDSAMPRRVSDRS